MRTVWFHIAVTRLDSILECSVFICLSRQCGVLFITYKLITSNCWLDNKIIILRERGKQRLMFSEYQSMKYEYFSALVFSPLMSILPRNRFCLVTQRSFFLIVEERCVTRQKRLQWRLFCNKWIRENLRSHSATSAEPRKLLGNFKDRHIQRIVVVCWQVSEHSLWQTLTRLLHTIFDRKGTSFAYLLLHDKCYPFHLPNLELCIPFNSCKCTVF